MEISRSFINKAEARCPSLLLFTLLYLEKSSLIVWVILSVKKMPWRDEIPDCFRADRQHGELRLEGVDHVGHGAGEVFLCTNVDLVDDHGHTEYLTGQTLIQESLNVKPLPFSFKRHKNLQK